MSSGLPLPADDFAALATTVDTEEFRAALGRVACGYDGGQIVDEGETANPVTVLVIATEERISRLPERKHSILNKGLSLFGSENDQIKE